MKPTQHVFSGVVLSTTLALSAFASAQGHDAAPPTANPPKVEVPIGARNGNQSVEPGKGTGTLALPNGGRFAAGLPAGGVLFDDACSPIWAEGGNYKASFGDAGFTFVPYLGADAPQSYPVSISLQSAQLGAALSPLTAAASPRRQGNSVTIDRGVLVERYDLTPAHVEQKFVVATPFAGDLTLTLRVQTEMLAGSDAAGLRFCNALGHVGYTNAVLVDALGRRSTMQTEYADGRITLRAPASAIASAVFPLTVDPIVQNFSAATSPTHVLTNSDIAFSPVANHYLVVWTRVFSATDTDLHAVSVDANGVVVGGSSSLIDNTLDRWDDGRVAACGNSFMAVASRRAQSGGTRAIWGRVRAVGSPFTMGAAFQVNDTESGDKVSPDVGGGFHNAIWFCVAWQRNVSSANHDINYRLFNTNGEDFGPVRPMAIGASDDDYRPRISNSHSRDQGGPFDDQYWTVVWQRKVGTQHDIYGARVQKNGTLRGTFSIDTSSDDDTQPTVSTMTDDSRYFMVAYTTNNTGNLDIFTRVYFDQLTPFSVAGGFLAPLENLSAALRARDQSQPQIDSDGCRFAVSYLERHSATDRDAYVTTLDLVQPTLAAVDRRVMLTFSPLDTQAVGIAAKRGVAGSANEYGIVWDHNSTTAPVNSAILGATYLGVTPGGGFATRATACGGLAISYASGSQIPAPGNTIHLGLAGPSPRVIIVGTPMTALSLCPPASCALGAALTVVLPGPSLTLAIPCASNLVGATLAVQGAAFPTSGVCAGLGQLVTSDTVDITIR